MSPPSTAFANLLIMPPCATLNLTLPEKYFLSTASNVTNNENELCKTVRLTSLQNS